MLFSILSVMIFSTLSGQDQSIHCPLCSPPLPVREHSKKVSIMRNFSNSNYVNVPFYVERLKKKEKELTNDFIMSATVSFEKHSSIICFLGSNKNYQLSLMLRSMTFPNSSSSWHFCIQVSNIAMCLIHVCPICSKLFHMFKESLEGFIPYPCLNMYWTCVSKILQTK